MISQLSADSPAAAAAAATACAVSDPARLQALRDTGLLDAPAEEAFDRFTRLAAGLLGCPVTLVSLVEEDRQFFLSHCGLPEPRATERETPLSHSFCKYVVEQGEPLIIPDAQRHPLVCDNPAVTEYGVGAYLGYPLVTKQGHILGTLCALDSQPRDWTDRCVQTLHDLAAMLLSEIELRHAAKHLRHHCETREEDASQREERAAMVVHDIRNPLSSMILALEMLENSQLDANQRDTLSIAQASAERLLGMVCEVLDCAKADAGKFRLHLDHASVPEIVQATMDQLRHLAYCTGVTLRSHIGPHLPSVFMDREKIHRVLINLVANAIQHSPRGTVTISASLAPGGEALRLQVVDTGSGIPADRQARLFEKYGTAEDRKNGAPSTGLGLHFCKKVIEAHHGEIGVTSVPGEGATFTATISTRLERLAEKPQAA